ncbi:hypothetical protein LTR02_012921 [Friedmanniomyces endolithicus]|nr:hypothetical protein LTR94_016281 [Friedmanniomyces endolithicus]KAK0785430.1 hypothetical protein LTR75_013529 [Friedmanniomyces endolithicus]KAK0801010.1 hypothetical protein LTR59_005579 [Friedmanniomyces endolithicus]KAK0874442.1 hypothetical protein LTR87_011552 [Friedmanniomyces endolithicus]KAK0893302.1 hypothetical protein LTR02_012921 [Friedmanniomyces endolithicus]
MRSMVGRTTIRLPQQPDSPPDTTSKMPSQLRLQAQFEPISANATYQVSPPSSPPAKKQKMSLTSIYYTASTARTKLGREANRADHNLRRLVGHANLLDSLMIELSSAEREQESWFNQSLSRASKPEEPKHIQWLDEVAEAEMEDDSDSEDGSDYDDDAEQLFESIPTTRVRRPSVHIDSMEIDDDRDDDEDDEDAEFDEEHALQRTPSSRHSPPELLDCDKDDSSSDSEDESMPSSPENQAFEIDEKERAAITTTAFYDTKAQHGLEQYIMQQSQQRQAAPLIAAY